MPVGSSPPARRLRGRCAAGGLGEVAREDSRTWPEAERLHRAQVTRAARTGARSETTIDVEDTRVAESSQVFHGQPCADGLVGQHAVDPLATDRS
jgi:hypothetical protein